ncbi:MAG: sensor histidine kinase, partial [Pseudomonadota bacterium]
FQMRSREAEIERSEQKLLIAEQEAAIAGLETGRWQMQAVVAALAALSAIVLALYFARAFREQKQAVEFQKFMTKELLHRSKNNLQLVQSLLRISDYDGHDVDAKEDMSNRIKAIAIAQERLARPNTATDTIDVAGYLTDLLEHLERGLGRAQVKFNVSVEDVNTKVDRVIPLGLLINEAVTNCYKYAFDESGGQINVRLVSCQNSDGYSLIIEDQPERVQADETPTRAGFGHSLIKLLAEQLGAIAEQSRRGSGTLWRVEHIQF